MCERLTDRPGPSWLNRAASIGVALPCVVPRDWIEAPGYDTADGALLGGTDDVDEDDADESSRMLRSSAEQPRLVGQDRESGRGRRGAGDDLEWDSEDERRRGGTGKGKGKAPVRDSAGRNLPAAERAPTSRAR